MLNIQKTNDYKFVKELFQEDPLYLSFYPLDINNSLDACIENFVGDLNKVGSDLEFYKLSKETDTFGFFGLQRKNILTTFFLRCKYRNKDNKKQFWKEILNKVEFPFFTPVIERNYRALRFFKENGAKYICTYNNGVEIIQLLQFDDKGDI